MKVRAGARKVGMLMKSGHGNAAELKKRWRAEIKGTFPHMVVEVRRRGTAMEEGA